MVIFVGVAGCGRGPPPNGLLRRARLSSSVGPLFGDRIVTYAATTLAKLVLPSTAIFLTHLHSGMHFCRSVKKCLLLQGRGAVGGYFPKQVDFFVCLVNKRVKITTITLVIAFFIIFSTTKCSLGWSGLVCHLAVSFLWSYAFQ